MKRQIEKMLAASKESRRRAREEATNFPWAIPVFAIAFAIGKLTRLVTLCDGMISLAEIDAAHMAEELRECAHYLLRASELLDPDEQDPPSTQPAVPRASR